MARLRFPTLTEFLNANTNPSTNDLVEFEGYSTKGDGGSATWRHNGVTGQTPSQSPADLGDALINDASGNQWAYVAKSSIKMDDLGANGDGVTDNRSVFVAAVAAALSSGLPVEGGAGQYVIDTDGGTIALRDVSFIGSPTRDKSTQDKAANPGGDIPDSGTILFIKGTTNSPFTIYAGGVKFEKIRFFYPDQNLTSSPTAYPPIFNLSYPDPLSIANNLEDIEISECTFYNAYHILDHSDDTYSAGNIIFKNNRCLALNRGLTIARHNDIVEVKDNVFSISVYDEADLLSDDVKTYTLNNCTILEIGTGEGLVFTGNFLFQVQKGIVVTGSTGVDHENLFVISDNIFDQVPITIQVSSGGHVINGTISSNVFLSKDQVEVDAGTYDVNAVSIAIQTTLVEENELTITGNTFSTTTGRHIYITGSSTDLINITGNNFVEFGQNQTSPTIVAAIQCDNSNADLVITSNRIRGLSTTATRRGIFLSAVSRAIIDGNRIDECTNAIQVNSSTDLIVTSNITTNTSGTAINITAPSGTLVNTNNITA